MTARAQAGGACRAPWRWAAAPPSCSRAGSPRPLRAPRSGAGSAGPPRLPRAQDCTGRSASLYFFVLRPFSLPGPAGRGRRWSDTRGAAGLGGRRVRPAALAGSSGPCWSRGPKPRAAGGAQPPAMCPLHGGPAPGPCTVARQRPVGPKPGHADPGPGIRAEARFLLRAPRAAVRFPFRTTQLHVPLLFAPDSLGLSFPVCRTRVLSETIRLLQTGMQPSKFLL